MKSAVHKLEKKLLSKHDGNKLKCSTKCKVVFSFSELEAEDWFKVLSIECLGMRPNDISMGEPDLLAAGVQCEHTGTTHTYIHACMHARVAHTHTHTRALKQYYYL